MKSRADPRAAMTGANTLLEQQIVPTTVSNGHVPAFAGGFGYPGNAQGPNTFGLTNTQNQNFQVTPAVMFSGYHHAGAQRNEIFTGIPRNNAPLRAQNVRERYKIRWLFSIFSFQGIGFH